MNILITGHNGMVGKELKKVLSDHTLTTPSKYQLNVGNVNQVLRFKNQKIDFIIHLAAETDHEYCEENPSQCYFTNTIGTGNMVKLARALDIPILYLSAGSIFDGLLERPYTVFDKPNPVNHYNTSKWYAEALVKDWEKHYIVRAGWMFGGGQSVDKKFVHKIITKIRSGEKDIKVCDDCIGSPTYSFDLSQGIKSIIEDSYFQDTYHVVNESNGVSRFLFAKKIVEFLGVDTTIIPVSIDDLKEEFPCKRTNYEVLQSSIKLRSWEKALEEYINDNYRH